MKYQIRLLLGVGLLTPIFLVAGVLAIAREDGSPSRPLRQGEVQILTAQEATDQAEPRTQEVTPETTIEERIAKRKTEKNIRLTNAQAARLRTRCKASQGKLSSLEGRINGLETSRAQVYANLNERLVKMRDKLKADSVETTDLDSHIQTVEQLVSTFNANLGIYKQAVSDLAIMDCAGDPTGFKASLEAARTDREKVQQAAATIKAYLKETVKPALTQLKSQLQKQSEGNS